MSDATSAPRSSQTRPASTHSAGLLESEASSSVIFTTAQTGRARDLLARLAGARRSVTFYPRGHEVVRDNIGALMQAIAAYHREGVDVPLVFFDNELLLGEQLLAAESVIFDQLIRDMSASGETSVTFLQGLTTEELERAMQVLAADRATLAERGGLEAAVDAADIPHVEIGTVAYARDAEDFDSESLVARSVAVTEALDAIRDIGDRIRRGTVPSVEQARSVVRSMVDNVLEDRGAMLEIGGLKDRSEYTFCHSVNVMTLSVALGTMLTDNKRFLNSLGVGALLHDVGLISEELDALVKAGELSSDEWDLMRMHPVYGAEVAASMRGLDRASIVMIFEHHLRFDGAGYPAREPQRPQHLTSRIVGIADAYDAMTSERKHAQARRPDEAMQQIADGSGTAFDPVLVQLFTQMMGVYPPRSLAFLSSGELAVVTRPNADPLAPWVRVISDAAGALVEPNDVDLSDPGSARGRVIDGCVDPAQAGIDVDEYLPRP